MKLLIIYGPPAVGKLTVAKELSKITDYNLFHNHLTLDLITPFIKFGKKDFWYQVHKIRLDLFELAAKKKVDLIFTWCYNKGGDDKKLNKIIRRVKKHDGEVIFAQLTTSKEILLKRVKRISRKNYGKVSSSKVLGSHLDSHDFFSSVPHKNNLKIDNTKLSAKKTAQQIKKYYKLK
jgi:RNase adaptor protein for sRNA GlmZ degradation